MSILKRIKKIAKNDFAFQLDDKDNPYTVNTWIDTGCYAINAALSDADIFKGIPTGKRVVIAGPSGVAKSLFIMYIVKAYLDAVENSYIVAFESEGATITEMAKNYNVPEDRMIILPVTTVEEFKTQCVNVLDDIIEQRNADKKNPPNFMMVLDSLGMLGTEKEYNDAVNDTGKADMTRAKQIRSIFRLITLKLTLSNTTFLMSNHTMANIGGLSPLPTQCMTKGTKIFIGDKLKNIEDFMPGDNILTMNGISVVEESFKYEDAEVFEIEFEDGYTVKCTKDHKFLTDDGFKTVLELEEDDDILTI